MPTGPELVFGLVGAIGADLQILSRILRESLNDVAYQCDSLRLSELLSEIPAFANLARNPLDARYREHMEAGTRLREAIGRADAMAVLAIRCIVRQRELRASALQLGDDPPPRVAYILHSLKRPEEVETLRRVYSPGFFLIGAYASRAKRLQRLEERIAASYDVALPEPAHTQAAEKLIQIDERERERDLGQNVRDTFPLADLFVDVTESEARIRRNVKRFIALLFGYPYHTPTREESGMFHARAAAVRSAEMGRQVGAAITNADGELLAVGTNEVPKAGGGLYWPASDTDGDHRDFTKGEDTSDKMKRNNLAEVLSVLRDRGLLSPEVAALPQAQLLEQVSPLMNHTRLMNSIEFGRAVHAEMDAITGAARRGISIVEGTLYTTTFPCHNCARHIIAAGLRSVVYIEPYAKSLASQFHQDAIVVEEKPTAERQVVFQPFVGVAPGRFLQLFQMVARKDPTGKRVYWDRTSAQPRIFPPPLTYTEREIEQSSGVSEAILASGLGKETTSPSQGGDRVR